MNLSPKFKIEKSTPKSISPLLSKNEGMKNPFTPQVRKVEKLEIISKERVEMYEEYEMKPLPKNKPVLTPLS